MFTALVKAYGITDKKKLILVRVIAKSWERCLEAEKVIEKLGIVVLDRYGNEKSNPANDILRQARDQMLRALKQLNVIEEHEEPEFMKDFGGIRY